MNLVVCNTPFQALQIINLVAKGIITNFDFFYFCKNKTAQVEYYFEQVKKHAISSQLYISDKRYPYHILDIRRLFKGRYYQSLYSASVDSVFTHSILSFIKFDNFYSFDDGSANLNRNSTYYIEQRGYFKRILFRLTGCKYDLRKTKSIIRSHYTVYKNKKNIVPNTTYIDFEFPAQCSDGRKETNDKNSVANVLLGTVYDEVFSDNEVIIKKLSCFFADKDFYYIPHPRDTHNFFINGMRIDGPEIAESKILSLLKRYETINLYGFGSSVQINMSSHRGVVNYVFDIETSGFDYDFTYKTITI